MNPLLDSILAIVFMTFGAVAVFFMLELKGNPKDRPVNKRLIWIHRIFGYLFVAVFLVMLIMMIDKTASFRDEFSARAVFHIALALAIVPLLTIKLLIVRRHKRLTSELLYFGVPIFLFAFVLSGLTAGKYFLDLSNFHYTTLSEQDAEKLDLKIGRDLYNVKCSKCHTLDRVSNYQGREGWTEIVNEMALLDAPHINEFDVKQIINYLERKPGLSSEKEAPAVDADIGKALVSLKCATCHDLDRVFGASKTADEWTATVARMTVNSGDPDFLTDEEKQAISGFLAGRK